MPKSYKELLERDTKRNIGAELLEAIREMKTGNATVVHHINVPGIIEARYRAGLSQAQFVLPLGVSKRTLQDWEQGRREPSGAARSLLKIARERPDVLREVLIGFARLIRIVVSGWPVSTTPRYCRGTHPAGYRWIWCGWAPYSSDSL